MAWHWWALRTVAAFEDRIVELILRRPGFHRAVGRIHKSVHEARHGRNPHEPLHQGEASANPNPSDGFLKHFKDEILRQFSGKPTDLAKEPGKTVVRKKP